ncbi:MAG: HEPN domain-containing protein [Phascolarctobacterium sp.]|nr:HEPN domain-containing protein [Phascolarctobacterium sp.]
MDEQAKALSKYRLEKARQLLQSADMLMNMTKDYNSVVNRCYYAIFHSVRSILALERKDFEKHSAVISYFRRMYIKTHIISVDASDILGEAFNSRNESDYKDFFEVSSEQAEQQLCNAKRFMEIVEVYLKSQGLE